MTTNSPKFFIEKIKQQIEVQNNDNPCDTK